METHVFTAVVFGSYKTKIVSSEIFPIKHLNYINSSPSLDYRPSWIVPIRFRTLQ